MTAILDYIRSEPVRFVALIQAVVIALVAFGVPITPEQRDAVLGLGAALLALFGGEVARRFVSPTPKGEAK